ncbi:MAG: heavy-metal-associated domain-containing protein [Clostridiales bacterium]|nr:heavy-metal-associated domain-containing protein [Clostridiales bacterium]
MKTTVYKVSGIVCGHCAKAVVKALGALSGVERIQVDPKRKVVVIDHNAALATPSKLRRTIEEQGYDVLM